MTYIGDEDIPCGQVHVDTPPGGQELHPPLATCQSGEGHGLGVGVKMIPRLAAAEPSSSPEIVSQVSVLRVLEDGEQRLTRGMGAGSEQVHDVDMTSDCLHDLYLLDQVKDLLLCGVVFGHLDCNGERGDSLVGLDKMKSRGGGQFGGDDSTSYNSLHDLSGGSLAKLLFDGQFVPVKFPDLVQLELKHLSLLAPLGSGEDLLHSDTGTQGVLRVSSNLRDKVSLDDGLLDPPGHALGVLDSQLLELLLPLVLGAGDEDDNEEA